MNERIGECLAGRLAQPMQKAATNRPLRAFGCRALLTVCLLAIAYHGSADEVGPIGMSPLEETGDLASDMIDGIDRFLLRQTELAPQQRLAAWQLDLTSAGALEATLQPHRDRLASAIGVVDQRFGDTQPQVSYPVDQRGSDGGESIDVRAIRWPVLADPAPGRQRLASLFGTGLLLTPPGEDPIATVIVLGDADQTAEQLSGLQPGLPPTAQVAKRLAAGGCRVIVVDLVSRHREQRGRANLTDREFLHRPALVLGRTLAGFEVQMTLALVDWLAGDGVETVSGHGTTGVGETPPIGLFGYGEGGMIALMAAGLDQRIGAVAVSGFLGPRADGWQEPLERNFFGLLRDFDAAELAMLLAGRHLIVETAKGPEQTLPGNGGTPAVLRSPPRDQVAEVVADAQRRLRPDGAAHDSGFGSGFIVVSPEDERFGDPRTLDRLLVALTEQPLRRSDHEVLLQGQTRDDPSRRREEHLQQIDRHTQALLAESEFTRQAYFSELDTSSLDAFTESIEPYRERFARDVIGQFDLPLLPSAARSRLVLRNDKWVAYEIALDVFDDVFAYGILMLPSDLKPGERRPVVVCQHGLEGRPKNLLADGHRSYHDYAAKLCENGLVVFAPQNPYLFGDRFRTLQLKARPLGKTLFSVIVPQHQAIVNWLKTQPFTDPERIAFYGLSYGGKTAMRVPALVPDYCLSICSGDFNEWVLKNGSSRHAFSYLWTTEYEIFEWNLGGTFNYAEMAALICPRPFMVERGHFDNVAEDHWVAYEFAKVRHLYAAQLGIADQTEIEWFVGPHAINGRGTFEFLSRHLDWPIEPMDTLP